MTEVRQGEAPLYRVTRKFSEFCYTISGGSHQLENVTHVAKILCRAVHIDEMERGAPLLCKLVVHDLNYGGKLVSSILD